MNIFKHLFCITAKDVNKEFIKQKRKVLYF